MFQNFPSIDGCQRKILDKNQVLKQEFLEKLCSFLQNKICYEANFGNK
jgi:hypothetical protein